MKDSDRRRIAEEEIYRQWVRAEYRAARAREGVTTLARGVLGVLNLGMAIALAGLWIIWSVLLFVVFVGTFLDGSEYAELAGLLFFLVFFVPIFWVYLKFLEARREWVKREEAEKAKAAREREELGQRIEELRQKLEKRRQKEGVTTGRWEMMVREWERRWSILTEGLPEEEVEGLRKAFLNDNPGRTDEERWQHIDRLFNEKSVP